MKSLLGILTILISVSAQAAPSANQVASVIQALNGPDCIDALEAGVYTATAFSSEAQANINSNLNLYSNLLLQAESNLASKRSNDGIFRQFKLIMDKHANETFTNPITGTQYETGKAVVGCIKRHVAISPTFFNSAANINAAQAKIDSLKKAAN